MGHTQHPEEAKAGELKSWAQTLLYGKTLFQ